jgi:hypothetical protein
MDRFIDGSELVAAVFIGIVAADVFLTVVLRHFGVDIPDSYDFGILLLAILMFWGIAPPPIAARTSPSISGVIAAGGTLGIMIPPSTVTVWTGLSPAGKPDDQGARDIAATLQCLRRIRSTWGEGNSHSDVGRRHLDPALASSGRTRRPAR